MLFRLTVLTLAAALVLASGHSSAQNPTLKTAMRDKLANMEWLLEAVVAADYAAIGRSADSLGRISDTEIMSWQPGAPPGYMKQATLFIASVQGLRQAAATSNVDAVLAEYTALVSSCARCHAHVRRFQGISFETPALR